MSDKLKFDRKAFKKAIAWVESSGGKHLSNPKSSAAGKYHFLYRYIKNIPLLRGVTKLQFIAQPDLQEKVMDMAIEGSLPGFPSYEKYAIDLKTKYGGDHTVEELAALTHFLGMGDVKKYMKNPSGFVVPGENARVNQYLSRFNKVFIKNRTKDFVKGKSKDQIKGSGIGNERGEGLKVQDKTAVKKPKFVSQRDIQVGEGADELVEYVSNKQGLTDENPVKQEEVVDEVAADDTADDGAQDELQSGVARTTPELNSEPQPVIPSISDGLAGAPDPMAALGFLQANQYAMGGNISSHGAEDIIPIENGGTHEQNPYGGVPMGIGANGKMNTVEEGEVKFGDYIFSNRLSLGGYMNSVDAADANTFAEGGDLDSTEPKKESKKNSPPVNPITDPIFGPRKDDKLEFTKSEMQHTAYGGLKKVSESFEVPDIREDYMLSDYISAEPGKVDFSKAVHNPEAEAFLNRYNNSWSREKLKEQSGITDEDIDNMILKGLNTGKQVGGNTAGSKASFDPASDLISMGAEHVGETGVETHERVHSSLFDASQGGALTDLLGSPWQQEGRSIMKKNDPEMVRYLKKDHEAYGNFAEFREKLGLKPGEQITPEQLKARVKKKGLTMENFYRVYNDKNISNALNTIASTDQPSQDEYRIA